MKKFLIITLFLSVSLKGVSQNYIGGYEAGSTVQNPGQSITSMVCDTAFSFPTVDNWPGGLTFDGTYFYSTAHDSTTVIKYDMTGQYSGHFALPSSSSSAGDLSFDGTNLWALVEQDNMLYRVDQNTGSILNSFSLTGIIVGPNDFFGCAYDNGSVWISHYTSELLIELDATTGSVLNNFPINRWVLPLTIVNGDLWGVDFVNNSPSGPMQLIKFDKTTGAVIDSVDWCLDYSLGATMANGQMWGLSSGLSLGTARIYGFESLFSSTEEPWNKNTTVTIYPNPSSDVLFIETEFPAEFEVLNVTGAVLLSKKTATNKTKVDISELSNGLYFLKFKYIDGTYLKKFIKY